MTEQERGPSTMTRNEAAERLRREFGPLFRGVNNRNDFLIALDAALATERRLTVERVREGLNITDETPDYYDREIGEIRSILDDLATADVDEDPISDSRQPEDGPPPGRWPR